MTLCEGYVCGKRVRTVQVDGCEDDVPTIRLNDAQSPALYEVEPEILCNVLRKLPAMVWPRASSVTARTHACRHACMHRLTPVRPCIHEGMRHGHA
eukprot:365574-Chlamydomonas_euryale.AAC.2